jgi:eukaryotic-like serine/threonine-protein kinase
VSRGRDFLGAHRKVRLIRAGHTCDVWETMNEDDGNRYALKIIKPEEKHNKLEIQSLRNEFEICNKLKHPNIIRIYEFNDKAEFPYLVMELFNANNLKIMLRQGPQRLFPIAKEIIEQSAEALYYFHENGYIHRDVKPDNFLVDEQGTVKLIDFAICSKQVTGMARFFSGWFSKVQGTRSYMSPEQIRNEVLDPRADIYSYGCVLFELFTGKAPYTGDTATDLLSKHITASVPSPQYACPEMAPEFSDLIRRMMSKEKAARPANFWEFLKTLRQIRIFKILPRKKEAAPGDDAPLPQKKELGAELLKKEKEEAHAKDHPKPKTGS